MAAAARLLRPALRGALPVALALVAAALLFSLARPLAKDILGRAMGLPLYRRLLLETLKLAALCTLACLLLGYPIAWGLRLLFERVRRGALFGLFGPAALASMLRVLGWLVVLGEFGLVNLVLRTLRLEAGMPPGSRFLGELAVFAGMLQVFFPFTVLALYRSLQAVPMDMVRAARSLGGTGARVFLRVVLPLSLPGALAAMTVVFALSIGAYSTVVVFGSRRVRAMAGLAVEQSGDLLDWQLGALALIAAGFGLYTLLRWLSADSPSRAPRR